jgi:hypothetical protein
MPQYDMNLGVVVARVGARSHESFGRMLAIDGGKTTHALLLSLTLSAKNT